MNITQAEIDAAVREVQRGIGETWMPKYMGDVQSDIGFHISNDEPSVKMSAELYKEFTDFLEWKKEGIGKMTASEDGDGFLCKYEDSEAMKKDIFDFIQASRTEQNIYVDDICCGMAIEPLVMRYRGIPTDNNFAEKLDMQTVCEALCVYHEIPYIKDRVRAEADIEGDMTERDILIAQAIEIARTVQYRPFNRGNKDYKGKHYDDDDSISIQLLECTHSKEEMVDILCRRARRLETASALRLLGNAEQYCGENPLQMAKINLERCHVYLSTGDKINEKVGNIAGNKAMEAEEMARGTASARTYWLCGTSCLMYVAPENIEENTKGEQLLLKAIESSADRDSSEYVASAHFSLGRYYYFTYQPEKCIEHMKAAWEYWISYSCSATRILSGADTYDFMLDTKNGTKRFHSYGDYFDSKYIRTPRIVHETDILDSICEYIEASLKALGCQEEAKQWHHFGKQHDYPNVDRERHGHEQKKFVELDKKIQTLTKYATKSLANGEKATEELMKLSQPPQTKGVYTLAILGYKLRLKGERIITA